MILWQHTPIKKKVLILLIVVMLIPIIAISITTYIAYTRSMNAQAKYAQDLAVLQVTNNVNAILNQQKNKVINIYKDELAQNYITSHLSKTSYTIDQFESLLFSSISPDVLSIYVFDYNSNVYGYNASFLPEGINYKELPEYKACMENKGNSTWISSRQNPYIRPEVEKQVHVFRNNLIYSLVVILRDFDSMNDLGFLIFNFDETYLYQLYSQSIPWADSQSFILDDQGYIVSHGDKNKIGKQASPTINTLLSNKVKGNLSSRIDGEDYMVVFNTCEVNGWKLVNLIPKHSLYQEGRKILYSSYIIIAVTIIFALYMGSLFSHSITRPIAQLASAMKKVEQGDLEVKIPYSSYDEIGLLTRNFNKMTKQIRTLLNSIYHSKIMKQEAEFKALQAQINPHFLYNTLETINWMALDHNVPKISDVVTTLGDLLRNTIGSDSAMYTMKDELNHIHKYLFIQKLRYSNRLSIYYNFSPECNALRLPRLILQPLVENALVHGIERKAGPVSLIITTKLKHDQVLVTITDTGVGISQDKFTHLENQIHLSSGDNKQGFIKDFLEGEDIKSKKKDTHIGLANINARIQLQYGDKYGINIYSKEGVYTQIRVNFPFKPSPITEKQIEE